MFLESNTMTENKDFLQTGGTLSQEAQCYVERSADDKLVKALDQNELCLVLAPRQTGKSSLMVHTIDKIRPYNIFSAVVDIQSLGSVKEPEKWFGDVVHKIERSLSLETDSAEWWEKHSRLGATQRFITFLEDVVLKEIKERVVIFVDEIDSILPLPFSDDFFTCIREVYNAKATNQTLRRVNFVLLGVATPSEFVKDKNRTPFNIGKMIRLEDFREEAVLPFKKVLGDDSAHLIKRIFYWCAGQPLIVHTLTADLSALKKEERTENALDTLVKEKYFDTKIEDNGHLNFIKNYLLSDKGKSRKTLGIYNSVISEKEVVYDESSAAQTKLTLAGVAHEENKKLVSRNRIYKKVFNNEWIRKNKPVNVPMITSFLSVFAMVIVVILVLIFRPVYEFKKYQIYRNADNDFYCTAEGEITVNIGIPDSGIKKITINRKKLKYNINDTVNTGNIPWFRNSNYKRVLPVTLKELTLGNSEYIIRYYGVSDSENYQTDILIAYYPKDEWQKIIDFKMVGIKEGCFNMGSDSGNVFFDEHPVHKVCLDSFAISKYEVTQSQWVNIMGYNPSSVKGDKNPVETVSWYDVMEFLRRLNKLTGEDYRLPTEAEWEYACRAGTETAYYWGDKLDTAYLWYYDNSNSKTHPVGKKKPNGFGLFDMSGNVWEWCNDRYGDYNGDSLSINPKGAELGIYRVIRGGSWNNDGRSCRFANRGWDWPGNRGSNLGFRLARGQKSRNARQ